MKILFKIEKKLTEAERYWKMFSPNKAFYQTWDVRWCFYKYFNYPLRFIVGFDGEKPIGVLPLQFNTDEKYLEFFGGSYMRDNSAFVKKGYESAISLFFNEVREKAKLDDISEDNDFTKSLPLSEYYYEINIQPFACFDEYLSKTFRGDRKNDMKRKLRIIKQRKVSIQKNEFHDIEKLFSMNIERFGKESTFLQPHRMDIFRDLLKLPFEFLLLTFIVDEKIVCVSLDCHFNNKLYSINSGKDIYHAPNIGYLMTETNFNEAFKHGDTTIYLGIGLGEWKKRWHAEEKPLHIFTRE